MRDFLKGGREQPQGQRYARLKIQNKTIPKTNFVLCDHEESKDENLTSDEKNSYASYLASIIYEYQLKLKYAGICLLTFLTLLSFDFAHAQVNKKTEILPLQIGDTIPEILWDMPLQVVNHPDGKDTIRLTDYRSKKLIILDFWATWCGPCINGLTKLDSLNQVYKSSMETLPITYQGHSLVKDFFEERGLKLPSIVENTVFIKFFPHKSIPHQIWLFEGKVVAIANGKHLTPANINHLMHEGWVDIPLKWENDRYDSNKPLFIANNASDGKELKYSSMISTYIDGLNNAALNIYNNRIAITNNNAIGLYQFAYQMDIPFYTGAYNRIVLEMDMLLQKQLEKPIDKDEQDQWVKDHSFCYDLNLPMKVSKKMLLDFMKSDLDRFFFMHYGIKAKVERKSLECLVLQYKDKKLCGEIDKKKLHLTGTKKTEFNRFVEKLSFVHRKLKTPIVSKVSQIDSQFHIMSDLTNLEHVNKELENYNLEIKKEVAQVDVLVIYQIK